MIFYCFLYSFPPIFTLPHVWESSLNEDVQGCAPFQWCMDGGRLILKLNAMGYTAQAYASDEGKLSTVTDLMQGSLSGVHNWRKTKG